MRRSAKEFLETLLQLEKTHGISYSEIRPKILFFPKLRAHNCSYYWPHAKCTIYFPNSFSALVMFDWDSQKDFINVDAQVERCTSDMLFQPDYEQNLAVVDTLSDKPKLYAHFLLSIGSSLTLVPPNAF